MTHPDLPEPFNAPLDEFLQGPDCNPLDIDPIFAKSVAQIIKDWEVSPEQLCRSNARASLIEPRLTFHDTDVGVILADGEKTVGAYLGCDLALDHGYRGKGLGRELVLERMLLSGENPVWYLDAPAYTPAGLATHEAAWRYARTHPTNIHKRISRHT